jgi:ribosomal protein S18 acetylase RimI-like enzyme
MTPVRIRAAVEGDAQAIARVRVRAWQVAYDGLMPADFLNALDPAESARQHRDRMRARQPDQAHLVAEDAAGTVVGFTECGDEQSGEGAGEVFAIYVDPGRWGTGTGRSLMDAAVVHLTRARPRPVRLWSLDGNERARRFYERYGFVADGVTGSHAVPGGELATVRFTLPSRA